MKKNYLIVTIGTRDVQLRRDLIEQPGSGWQIIGQGMHRELLKDGISLNARMNEAFPDYYTLASPRRDGEIIDVALSMHPSQLDEVLAIPLITRTLDKLQEEHKYVDTVLLIYTNQAEEFRAGNVSEFHYRNDTYYFARIVAYLLSKHQLTKQANIDYYEIWEQVADIDQQYRHFGKSNQKLFESAEEVEEVFLLPQGGIDQINHAITLQLIQAFEQRVRLFQQPESGEPKELSFSHQFLRDLNRQKLLKHIHDHEYGYVSALIGDSTLATDKLARHLAQYASKRLALQHNQLKNNIEFLSRPEHLAGWQNLWQRPMSTEIQKLSDLYIAIKIADRQQRYTECLWKLFTLNEVLFRIQVEARFGPTKYNPKLTDRNTENKDWLRQLNQCPGLVDSLRGRIWLNNPNRRAYFAIFEILNPDNNQLLRAGTRLERLAAQRHRMAHELGSTSRSEINNALGIDYSLDALFTDLDSHFDLNGFGDFDQIQEQLQAWV